MIGRRNEKIMLQSPVYTTDTSGEQYISSWSTIYDLWAELQFKGGKENYQMGQLVGAQERTFVTTYITGIRQDMRLVHGQDIYDITDIQPNNNRRETAIIAIKRDNET